MTATPHPNHLLVTGGCGFIGANLVALLVSSGYNVRVLDNLSKGSAAYLRGSNADIRMATSATGDTQGLILFSP